MPQATAPSEGPICISLADVLRTKLGPGRARRVPRFAVRFLERIICQDRLNELLRAAWPLEGADFCHAVLKELDVEVKLEGREKLPASGRALFVCNHPLGGLDGIAIIAALSEVYGPGLRFVVNDMLMAVAPLREVFVPVNKHGAQTRESASALEAALASDAPVVIFPAGLCSRRGKGGEIADLPWLKTFVSLARRWKRPVVPMFFSGRNSSFFYRFANLRKRAGIKLNIEMVRLPRELVLAEGSRYRLVCGHPVPVSELGGRAAEVASRIRDIVYSLASETRP
ncbi:MAG: 1-acyl-sn-glycerol-3-phosphate acyltransferase [Muribaculaceae bacterium]|nr:1-acyl-sn-glycerol-3-phosphate acyltransferase [Muribaculaceae bacterium]